MSNHQRQASEENGVTACPPWNGAILGICKVPNVCISKHKILVRGLYNLPDDVLLNIDNLLGKAAGIDQIELFGKSRKCMRFNCTNTCYDLEGLDVRCLYFISRHSYPWAIRKPATLNIKIFFYYKDHAFINALIYLGPKILLRQKKAFTTGDETIFSDEHVI